MNATTPLHELRGPASSPNRFKGTATSGLIPAVALLVSMYSVQSENVTLSNAQQLDNCHTIPVSQGTTVEQAYKTIMDEYPIENRLDVFSHLPMSKEAGAQTQLAQGVITLCLTPDSRQAVDLTVTPAAP